MKTKICALAGAAALSLMAFAPAAEAKDELTYALTLQATSDYMFRGLSYTEGQPALQAYGEVNYNIFYAAFWASRTDYLDVYGPWEFDVFLGARPTTGPINWDVGVWYYMFGSQDAFLDTGDLAYFEFKLGASFNPVDNVTLGVIGYYTPDQDLAVAETKTIEGSVSINLPKVGIFDPVLGGVLGWSGADTNGFFLGKKEYTYWNAGMKLNVEKFFMDFRYWDTTIDSSLADSRFVFSVGVNLP